MNHEKDKDIVLSLFQNIIYFLYNIFETINIEFYIEEVRYILFSLEKCIVKICKKIKMTKEMSINLKYLILYLTSKSTEKHNKKNEYFIYLRNEICKFLLDIELYQLTDFSPIENFLFTINDSLIKNSFGLCSIEIFKKILNFSTIFKRNILPQKDEIMHSKEFKSIKHVLSDVIINFLLKCDKIQPYNELFNLFSKEYEFDYKNYQYFKIFYLSSENFFENTNNKNIIPTIKYFIDLYEHLDEKDFNTSNDIIKKERFIVMALCLRIFLEYSIKENPPKFKEKKIRVSKRLHSSKVGNEMTKTQSLIFSSSDNLNLLDVSGSNINSEQANENNEKKVELNDIVANKSQIIDNNDNNINANMNKLLENKININSLKTNYASNTSSNISENINNFKMDNTDNTSEDQIFTHKKNSSSTNIINYNEIVLGNYNDNDNKNIKKRKISDENI
jgi:hypothetical protein